MILELAILTVKKDLTQSFERDFKIAEKIISSMKGFVNLELKKCIEVQNQYLLLVHWQSIEDHEIGFRQSNEYQEWKKLLHHYYDPFPTVQHYQDE